MTTQRPKQMNDTEGNLIRMAETGNVVETEKMLISGAPVDAQDGMPLQLACLNSHNSIIELLIVHRANPFHKNSKAWQIVLDQGNATGVSLLRRTKLWWQHSPEALMMDAALTGHHGLITHALIFGADLNYKELAAPRIAARDAHTRVLDAMFSIVTTTKLLEISENKSRLTGMRDLARAAMAESKRRSAKQLLRDTSIAVIGIEV